MTPFKQHSLQIFIRSIEPFETTDSALNTDRENDTIFSTGCNSYYLKKKKMATTSFRHLLIIKLQ